MPDTDIRCFIAISLPDKVKQGLKRAQVDLKRHKLHAGWPAPAGFHLTLAFLGDTPVVAIDHIKKAMKEAALESPGFELIIDRTGVFPSIKKARIIWAGFNPDTQHLRTLYQNLYIKLNTAGLLSTKQRFSPHITLARLKQRVYADKLKHLIEREVSIEPVKFHVKCIDLYESNLTPLGAIHTRLYSASLTNE